MELKIQRFKALRIYRSQEADAFICDFANKDCNKEMLSYRITDSLS